LSSSKSGDSVVGSCAKVSIAAPSDDLRDLRELMVTAGAGDKSQARGALPLHLKPRRGDRVAGESESIDACARSNRHVAARPVNLAVCAGGGRCPVEILSTENAPARDANRMVLTLALTLDGDARFDELSGARTETGIHPVSDIARASVPDGHGLTGVVPVRFGDRERLMRQRHPRRDSVPPSRTGHPPRVGCLAEAEWIAEGLRRSVQARPAGDDRRLDLVAVRQVVDGFRKQIAEAERDARVVQHLLEKHIEVAAASGHEPRSARSAPDRPLGGHRGAGAARGQVVAPALPRPVARREIQLRAKPPGKVLRVRPTQERHVIEDVAVDHRGGAAVLDQLDRVHEESRRHAVQSVVQVLEAVTPHDELAVEVVRGGHAGERLHGAQRIVERHPAKLPQLRAAERLLAGHAGLARAEHVSPHDDRFVVGRRSLAQRNDGVVLAGPDLDVAFCERVPDEGDVKLVRPRRKPFEAEPPFGVGCRRLRWSSHLHDDAGQRLARTRVDDHAGQGTGR